MPACVALADGAAAWSHAALAGRPAAIAAPAAVVWRRLPRWRPILALPVAMVMAGLFGADCRVVGDMVAGLSLGAACGVGAAAPPALAPPARPLQGRPDPKSREAACPDDPSASPRRR